MLSIYFLAVIYFLNVDAYQFRKNPKSGHEKLKKWSLTEPIAYNFQFRIPYSSRQRIRSVFQSIEKKTCLKFTEKRRSHNGSTPVVKVVEGHGCWSSIGMQNGTEQIISLPVTCTTSFGVVAHEILHLLGLSHTHSRIDRSNYVQIDDSNIHPIHREQFEIDPIYGTQTAIPYEFGSVMHYAAYGHALSPLSPSILPVDIRWMRTIGQRLKMSFLDIKQLNLLYNCYALSPCPSLVCYFGGVPSPSSCTCACPDGFAGSQCEKVQPSTDNNRQCGGMLEARSTWTTRHINVRSEVTSPFELLFMAEECWFHIESTPGMQVELIFTEFDGFCDDSCAYNGVELKIGYFEQTGIRNCCSGELFHHSFVSLDNLMVLGAYSRFNTTTFTIKYREIYFPPTLV